MRRVRCLGPAASDSPWRDQSAGIANITEQQASTAGGMLATSVANGGAPISEAAQQRLFQPFFRGERGPSRDGLGLGLHIASEIAKAHGGMLIVASDATETRFTFRMPLVR